MPAGPASQRTPCKESWEMWTPAQGDSSLIFILGERGQNTTLIPRLTKSKYLLFLNFQTELVLDRITVWIFIALNISLRVSLFFTELCSYAKCH